MKQLELMSEVQKIDLKGKNWHLKVITFKRIDTYLVFLWWMGVSIWIIAFNVA